MRILMVHNEYAKPSGEEHAARAIAGLLEANGHEVRWMLRSSAEIAESLQGKVQSFFSGIYSRESRQRIGRVLEREGPFDVVQAQNLYPLLSPSVLAECSRRGVPVVMRCPNYRLFCPNGLHLSRGEICERCLGGHEWWCALRNCEDNVVKSTGYAARAIFARMSGMIRDNVSVFIVLSEFQRQRFIAQGIAPERIAIVPNFEQMSAADLEEPPEPGDTISFAGRLSPEKGIGDFVEAARALPSLRFAVAGDTSLMPELVRSAPANVTFHGFLTGATLDAFYHRTRIFISPGLWFEGFPNVVTKAMIKARPVIASNLGALPEIVTDGQTGLLYPPHDVPELVAKIKQLHDAPGLCRTMGEAGRAKALREYSPKQAYVHLEQAYSLAGRPPVQLSALGSMNER